MATLNHHTFFQASKSSKSKLPRLKKDPIWQTRLTDLNKENWGETTKSAWNLKHPRIRMVVSMGWFQIFTWKMVVSQNPSIQNMVVSPKFNSLHLENGWLEIQWTFRNWEFLLFRGVLVLVSAQDLGPKKLLQLNPITVSHGTNGMFTSNLVGCPRHPVIFSAYDWGVQSPPQHSI